MNTTTSPCITRVAVIGDVTQDVLIPLKGDPPVGDLSSSVQSWGGAYFVARMLKQALHNPIACQSIPVISYDPQEAASLHLQQAKWEIKEFDVRKHHHCPCWRNAER